MDYSTAKQYARTTSTAIAMDGRRSFEAAPSPAARLHKQRSSHGMRSTTHGLTFPSASAPQEASFRGSDPVSGGFGDGTRARKGSIRNAVRKIFGRRSRDSIPQAPATSHPPPAATSRHTYHKSEPTALSPQPELPEPQADEEIVHRVLSDPYQSRRTPSMSRTGSPYAVQFPNSVRLKPMDLGNPFMAGSSQLRRRKTLPSILVDGREGAAAAADESGEPQPVEDVASYENTRDPPAIPQRTASSVKKSRRKSKSVDDLPATAGVQQASPRKRSDEIRYWRESFQPDVLRASGFVTKTIPMEEGEATTPTSSRSIKDGISEEQGAEIAPVPRILASYDSVVSREGTVKSSPPGHYRQALSVSEAEYRPSSGVGTEMSRDLEDRVAKLEAGLHNFQRSLQKLTADRNRRTIVMGGSITTRRSSGDMRSPSLLADTLADPLEPSSYEYEYGHTLRPSTSPQQPPVQVQGSIDDPFGPDLPPSLHSAGPAPTTARSPTPPPQATPETVAATVPGSSGSLSQPPQQYTFRSLYQMLADERSARRKLELQLRGLRDEISDLHNQVNLSSNVQSTRSSYMLAGSSSRLQNLLRETGESSPPQPRTSQHSSGVSGVSTGSAPKVSRFSGSESDVVQQEETDYEEYLTPREERSNWSLAEKLELENKENELF